MDLPFLIRGVGVVIFAAAAVSDYRTRRAPNDLWLAIAALGVVALALELRSASARLEIVTGVALCTLLLSAIAVSAHSNGYIGGADGKAIMVLPIIFPHPPGQAFQSGVLHTLTLGVEAAIWVWIGTAIAAVWYSTVVQHENSPDGIPFLVPMFSGILSLFAISIFVI